MNKLSLIVLTLFLIFLILITFRTINSSNVKINNKTFYVYVASTDEQKSKGLAIFNSLPEDKGMIFPFSSPDYYAFWMKDMKFPIDIIYINQDKIVDMFQDVPPPKTDSEELPVYKPSQKANYVLEINAGLSKKYNIEKGDLVKIHI